MLTMGSVIYRKPPADLIVQEHEMHHPTEGILAAFDRLAEAGADLSRPIPTCYY